MEILVYIGNTLPELRIIQILTKMKYLEVITKKVSDFLDTLKSNFTSSFVKHFNFFIEPDCLNLFISKWLLYSLIAD